MLKSFVMLELPLKLKGAKDRFPLHIADYNYDIGLDKNEVIKVENRKIGYEEDDPFTFTALVTKKVKKIKAQKDQDMFEIVYTLEIADKEEIPRIVEILKRLNPEKFEDEL